MSVIIYILFLFNPKVPRKKRRPHTACSFPSGHRRDLLSDDEYDRSDSSRWGDKSARSPRVASHTVFSDFSDDIFSDSGWDTDLEVEGDDCKSLFKCVCETGFLISV